MTFTNLALLLLFISRMESESDEGQSDSNQLLIKLAP